MQFILISSSDKFNTELDILPHLFENGLDVFHLRKPKYSYRKMKEYLSLVPKNYHNRIIIHSHHLLALTYNLKGLHITRKQKDNPVKTFFRTKFLKLIKPELAITTSFHSLKTLLSSKRKYEYVFLSPVFDSISKLGHKGVFMPDELKNALRKIQQKVIALGGLEINNVRLAKEYGFAGIALQGAIWKTEKNRVETFKEIKKQLDEADTEKLNLQIKPIRVEI